MKDIEITCRSETEALETASREFRLPKETFEILESKALDPSDRDTSGMSYVVKLRLKKENFRDLVKDRVAGLLKHMEIPAEVRVHSGEDFLNADIFTQQGSLLIGRRGETLDALQHILNRMISRNDRDMPMILLDVEGYRDKIHRRLKKIAFNAVEKVQRTGQPVKLEPMAPHDRKYIHKLLSEIVDVTTYSMGREGQRYVVIACETSPERFIGKDEELLPEFLDDPALGKRQRPLFQENPIQNIRSKIHHDGDGMDDLLDPENEKEAPPEE